MFSQNIEYIKQNISHIEVTGMAEITVKTDEASFSFTVSATGSSLREAVKKARSKISETIDKLKSEGVKEKQIQTSRFFSSENYGDKAFLSSSRDFKSSITATITLKDLKLLEAAVFIVSESKPDYISDISFDLDDDTKYKNEALQMAIQDAYTKAKMMASASNSKVGKLLYSSMMNYYPQPMQTMRSDVERVTAGKVLVRSNENMFYAKDRVIMMQVRAIYQVD